MIAAIASTGAAVVSLVSALYSYGVLGHAESHETIGNFGATWVGVRPVADTATALGDTLHFAATITDRNGSILVGAHPAWTTDDPRVATVLRDGSVVAHGPGTTMIAVAVGNLIARARVVVVPRVTAVQIAFDGADSAVHVAEGAAVTLRASSHDARGNAIAPSAVHWHVDDSSVATIDSSGVLTARNAGRSIVTAGTGGVVGHAPVVVFAAPAAIDAVAGAGQRAIAGTALPQPIVVRVTSRRGRPIEGELVSFRSVLGRGMVAPDTARTDADGRAHTSWTLADVPGRQRLIAGVDHLDTTAVIVAEADPIATDTRIAPLVATPAGIAGAILHDTVGIRVTDSVGRALADVPVSWAALDGAVHPIDARTDSLGVARARWVLGPRTGAQRLRAQVGATEGPRPVAPVTITASAAAGPPAGLIVTSGDDQQAPVGAALARAIVVRVVDAAGNRVAGAALVLSPSAGVVRDTAIRTDSSGMARIRWTMGRAAGHATLGIHVDGVTRLTRITAHATPSTAANLSFDDAPPLSARRAPAAARRLVALVTDVYGNPVPDVRVRFSTNAGTVSPARAATDARGRVSVTWSLRDHEGERVLAGSVVHGDVTGRYILEAQPHHPRADATTVRRTSGGTRTGR